MDAPTDVLRAGSVLWLANEASCQFSVRPIRFRVIRPQPWDPIDGWIWLDGYELNGDGDAVERRSVFVLITGVRVLAGAG